MPANYTDLEKQLWDADDELRANSKLRAADYSLPVPGLIFLKYAFQIRPARGDAASRLRCAARRRPPPQPRPARHGALP